MFLLFPVILSETLKHRVTEKKLEWIVVEGWSVVRVVTGGLKVGGSRLFPGRRTLGTSNR